jgi:outer membrane protein OmpA-like peptidoglycan-associated protein/tetratricopeptide (TPR) repeat protein
MAHLNLALRYSKKLCVTGLQIALAFILTVAGLQATAGGVATFGRVVHADSTAKTTKPVKAKKNCQVVKGDKTFAKLKFGKAIKHYTKALTQNADTLRDIQRIAESYMALNNTAAAEQWYARLANNENAPAINKYRYAELLKSEKNYAGAIKYYEAYVQAAPTAKAVKEAIGTMNKIGDLSSGSEAWSVQPLKLNSPKSDYAPAFYQKDKIIFTSNRSCKKATYDKWSLAPAGKLYTGATDSTGTVSKLNLGQKCKWFETAGTLGTNSELIYGTGSFKKSGRTIQNGKMLPALKLYSAILDGKKGKEAIPLQINGDQYSTAHASVSKDGKTMYFASDRLGGQGGTDIYVCTRVPNGTWGQPKNLGPEINSPYDEKFPFIADNGTLYFSSNNPNGLGGLDIYRSVVIDGSWSKPENLGTPVNSSNDDFSFIIDATGKSGYFASNRPGGSGEDDIYRFTYDETKIDYTVTVKVIDAASRKPLEGTTLALDCKLPTAENSLTDKNGEKDFTIKGGRFCEIDALRPGYRNGAAEITPNSKNGKVVIELTPDNYKLRLVAKDGSTMKPVRNITLTLVSTNGGVPVNYTTGDSGYFETAIDAGEYAITSPEYSSLHERLNATEADVATGVLNKTIFIPKEKMIVSVPLSSSCFSSAVSITDLKTGGVTTISPNNEGSLQLNLKMNNRYVITHNERSDTISTIGLRPGAEIPGPCKYYVGQTWLIPNVYYDVNKWIIRKDAAAELDKLAAIMKENPTLEIELTSHTDCRSSARYNIVLSARRAKSVVDYMVKKGIKAKRILAVGYGESRLTNGCFCEPSNTSTCDFEQHQANRRTEVKVLKY